MKVEEDNKDLSDKWKSQAHLKDGQISIMNEQIEQHQRDLTKYKNKVKDLNSNIASLESKVITL